MENTKYYKTDLGIVVKDETIRLKSTYDIKVIVSEEDFNNANPVKISKNEYLRLLNKYFNSTKHSWDYNGEKFIKLDNFEENLLGYTIGKNLPIHKINNGYHGNYFMVIYHNKLYYTFFSGNYFPRMHLCDLNGYFTGKWTHIKNLAPIFNKTTKQIV